MQKEGEEHTYRIYVSDVLKGIAENTATLGGIGFRYRWVDIISNKVDTRSADEIVEDVIKASGLEVVE